MKAYSLEYYAEKAKGMTIEEMHYARLDLQRTIELRRDLPPSHPYMAKLLNERDAILTEWNKR